MIDSTLVGQEVLIYIKRCLNGSVSQNFCLNVRNSRWDCIYQLAKVQISLEINLRNFTFVFTFGSRKNFSTRLVLSSGMVVTRCKRVGLTFFSYYSVVLKIFPCAMWISALTSFTTSQQSTTAQHISGGNFSLLFLSTSNTNSVAHGLNCCKSPTRSASALISDLLDGITLGPKFAGVKSLWNILKLIAFSFGKAIFGINRQGCTHHLDCILQGDIDKLRVDP